MSTWIIIHAKFVLEERALCTPRVLLTEKKEENAAFFETEIADRSRVWRVLIDVVDGFMT